MEPRISQTEGEVYVEFPEDFGIESAAVYYVDNDEEDCDTVQVSIFADNEDDEGFSIMVHRYTDGTLVLEGPSGDTVTDTLPGLEFTRNGELRLSASMN